MLTTKPSDIDDADTSFFLGAAYHLGRDGYPLDEAKAIQFYKRANAIRFHSSATLNLATLLVTRPPTHSTPEYEKNALALFLLVYKHFSGLDAVIAAHNLGLMHAEGRGTPQTPFKKAQEMGCTRADLHIATLSHRPPPSPTPAWDSLLDVTEDDDRTATRFGLN